jgi:hypothetical protein
MVDIVRRAADAIGGIIHFSRLFQVVKHHKFEFGAIKP